ncbi:MAG: hypothetical protein WEC12_03535 [Balneolaceae bacterium]
MRQKEQTFQALGCAGVSFLAIMMLGFLIGGTYGLLISLGISVIIGALVYFVTDRQKRRKEEEERREEEESSDSQASSDSQI